MRTTEEITKDIETLRTATHAMSGAIQEILAYAIAENEAGKLSLVQLLRITIIANGALALIK